MKWVLIILPILLIVGCKNPSDKPYFCSSCQEMFNETRYGIEECATAQKLQNISQVKEFMAWDRTDKKKYTDDFMCGSFARNVIRNAEQNNINAGQVVLKLSGYDSVHIIVVFPTVYDGDVFVDATQGDWWVDSLVVGNEYHSCSMYNSEKHTFENSIIEAYQVQN